MPKIHGFENQSRIELLEFYENYKVMEEKISKVKDEFYEKNEDMKFLADHFIDTYKVTQSAKLFHSKLINDNLEREFIKYRDLDEVRAQKWATTTTIINSPIFNLEHAFIIKREDKIYVPFPFSTYSYLRDFELFFKLIVDPIFKRVSPRSKKTKYITRLKKFCREPGKQHTYHSIVTESLRPFIRSQIAHQQYYVDLNEQNIYFFNDINWENQITKTISFDKLLKMATNTNLLLWHCLALIWRLVEQPKLPEWFPKEISEVLTKLESNVDNFFPELFQLESLNSFFNSSWDQILSYLNPSNWVSSDQDPASFQRLPILDSCKFVKMSLENTLPDHLTQVRSNSFALYLVGYSLIEERILKPLVKAIHPSINLSEVKDKGLLDKSKQYSNEGLKHIIQRYDPDSRNAIAHCDYFLVDERVYRRKISETNPELLAIKSTDLIIIFDKYETVLDPLRDKTLFILALKRIMQLLFTSDDIVDIGEFKTAADQLRAQDIDLYNVLAIICDFARALYSQEEDDQKELFNDINEYGLKNPKRRDIMWSWFYNFSKIKDIPLALKLQDRGIKGFHIEPSSQKGKGRMWQFKGLHILSIGDKLGARACLIQSEVYLEK